MYVCMYLCMYLCMCVYTYKHVYTYDGLTAYYTHNSLCILFSKKHRKYIYIFLAASSYFNKK